MGVYQRWAPPQVEARQIAGTLEDLRKVADWCKGSVFHRRDASKATVTGVVFPSGYVYESATQGEWIVKENDTRFRKYSNDLFHKTFIKVGNV